MLSLQVVDLWWRIQNDKWFVFSDSSWLVHHFGLSGGKFWSNLACMKSKTPLEIDLSATFWSSTLRFLSTFGRRWVWRARSCQFCFLSISSISRHPHLSRTLFRSIFGPREGLQNSIFPSTLRFLSVSLRFVLELVFSAIFCQIRHLWSKMLLFDVVMM